MTPPSNTINSSTMPFHFHTSTPKPPNPHRHQFPAPLPQTGKSHTLTPATPVLSATSPTSYDKAVSSPAHFTSQTTLAFLPRGSALLTTHNTTTANPQFMATPQKHPLPRYHAPGLGRRRKIYFGRRRTCYDLFTRQPRRCLPPEGQKLGHPP